MDLAENMRFIGFCGVDDSVSVDQLQLTSQAYPWVEWGFLFRPDMEGQPRYPTSAYVAELVKANFSTGSQMNLAGHLCGERCQEILEGNFDFVKNLASMGFGRVQVNATAANNVAVVPAKIRTYVENIMRCIKAVPEVEWIIQCNTETQPIWKGLVGPGGKLIGGCCIKGGIEI